MRTKSCDACRGTGCKDCGETGRVEEAFYYFTAVEVATIRDLLLREVNLLPSSWHRRLSGKVFLQRETDLKALLTKASGPPMRFSTVERKRREVMVKPRVPGCLLALAFILGRMTKKVRQHD